MGSLVTIIISTYNSAPFIIETLQSVSSQTWKELELIITDDFSLDDTVEVTRNWLNENKQRFKRAEILTSEKNTGVSANANRGLSIAKGEWIKFLGADDTLKPACIEDNMTWISTHPEIKTLFSRIEVYIGTFNSQNLIETIPGIPYDINGLMNPGRTADSQYKMLLLSDRIHFTPSVFLHRETLLKVGAFDERFKLLEDYPLWLNLTKNGHKLNFMDKITVNYRRHAKAINNTGVNYLINPNYFKLENFRRIYTYPFLPFDLKLNARFYWYASQVFRCRWINWNTRPNRILLLILTTYLNPFKYYIFIKKRLIKNHLDIEFYG